MDVSHGGAEAHTNGTAPHRANGSISPVLIVGGGPVGLTCSILLSLRKIPHLLFERHVSTSIHPKAAGINQRTTEIFRVMGIEDEVYAHAAPAAIAGRTAWYTSLGESGREVYSRDAWGGGEYKDEYAAFSPSRYCILPQIRLEPILKRRALQLNPSGIFYNTEVLTAENTDACSAVVTVRCRKSGEIRSEAASFVIIADGGRSFTDKLGIKWAGEGSLYDMVTAHVRAPIRQLHHDPTNFMTWFTNPEMGGSTNTGYLYQIGPWPDCLTNPALEEWVFACGMTQSDSQNFNEERMIQRLKSTINIPDLDIELLSYSHWTVNAIYAERWRVSRIFLAGDAGHRIPPWGALGMNTGIQDVQNLVWKLELALKDPGKYEQLLDTYEAERLDIGRRVGVSSLENMRSHTNHIDRALGITPDQSREENIKAAAGFFDATRPDHVQRKALVAQASKQLDSEFKAPGYEVGWFYPSADLDSEGGVNHGGQLNPDGSVVYHTYYASTIPGHHLPHAWVEDQSGKCLALRDLLRLDQLTLFKGNPAYSAVESDDRVHTVTVGTEGWRDTSGQWEAMRGVDESGGVLVRPDAIVAWRGTFDGLDEQGWRRVVDRVLRIGP